MNVKRCVKCGGKFESDGADICPACGEKKSEPKLKLVKK